MLLQKEKELDLVGLVERLDKLDVLILKKFYVTNEEFPSDIKLYAFPILFKELKEIHNIKLTEDAIRKRLKKLCEIGLITQVKNSNPSIFLPKDGMKEKVKELIRLYISYLGLENIGFI